jgi:hypothetical protein
MPVNSVASKPPPLYYYGVCARIRYSWTSSKPGRKWYGCVKYKVILKLILCFIFSLVVYDIYSYVFTQEAGDSDFFQWADNGMTAYEKKLEEHMRGMEEGRRADIDRLEKRRKADIDRLEKLIQTKYKE